MNIPPKLAAPWPTEKNAKSTAPKNKLVLKSERVLESLGEVAKAEPIADRPGVDLGLDLRLLDSRQ